MPSTSIPSVTWTPIAGWTCAGLDSAAFAALPVWTRACLAASDLFGWHYPGADGNHFPAQRGSLPSQLVKPGVAQQGIDCSSQSSYLAQTMNPYAAWTEQDYADMQIFDANRPWSPMDVPPRLGIGVALAKAEDAVEGDVVLSQAWVDASTTDGDSLSGGHARVCRVGVNGALEVLESTNRTGPYNPLGFGPTRTYTTLAALQAKYTAGVRFCRLF